MKSAIFQPNQKHSRVCILLTATIDPKGIVFMERSDPVLREQDYIKAMQQWVCKTEYSIIFCENSSGDLANIEKVVKNSAHKNVEFLQFDGQYFERKLGKGYGELLTIQYVMEHSRCIKQVDHIIKINGRYFVKNIDSIINAIVSAERMYVMADIERNLTWAESKVFAFTPEFAVDYLLKFQSLLNDSQGFFLEHALARAILRAMSDGHLWMPLPVLPTIEGSFATSDTTMGRSKNKQARERLLHYIRNWLLKRSFSKHV